MRSEDRTQKLLLTEPQTLDLIREARNSQEADLALNQLIFLAG